VFLPSVVTIFGSAVLALTPTEAFRSFPIVYVAPDSTNLIVCVDKADEAKPLTALIFRRDSESYVRVAIAMVSKPALSRSCPGYEAALTLPHLMPETLYVAAIYSMSSTNTGGTYEKPATYGASAPLELITYFGLSMR